MKDEEIQKYFNANGHLKAYVEKLNKLDPFELVQLLVRIRLESHFFVRIDGILTGELVDLDRCQYPSPYIIEKRCIVPVIIKKKTE